MEGNEMELFISIAQLIVLVVIGLMVWECGTILQDIQRKLNQRSQ